MPKLGLLVAIGAAACVSAETASEPDGAVRLGVLLPFTGDFSSTAPAAERALILASEVVNDHGGVAGRPLYFVSRDTQSDFQAGVQVGRELIQQEHIEALFGPEDDDVALALVPNLVASRVLAVSGSTTSTFLTVARDDGLFFRTVPSGLQLGRQLAARALADGHRVGAAVGVANSYGGGMAKAIEQEFVRQGGSFAGTFTLDPGAAGFQTLLRDLADTGADALFLITYPVSGARLLNEWSLVSGIGQWYLAPTLHDPVLVENTFPGLLETVVGVVPGVADPQGRFADAYARRWDGERPLRDAYFYFDALLLWALAAEAASAANGGVLAAPADVAEMIASVGGGPGVSVTWDAWDSAKRSVASGGDVDLEGVSGPLEVDSAGDVGGGDVVYWHVADGVFVDE